MDGDEQDRPKKVGFSRRRFLGAVVGLGAAEGLRRLANLGIRMGNALERKEPEPKADFEPVSEEVIDKIVDEVVVTTPSYRHFDRNLAKFTVAELCTLPASFRRLDPSRAVGELAREFFDQLKVDAQEVGVDFLMLTQLLRVHIRNIGVDMEKYKTQPQWRRLQRDRYLENFQEDVQVSEMQALSTHAPYSTLEALEKWGVGVSVGERQLVSNRLEVARELNVGVDPGSVLKIHLGRLGMKEIPMGDVLSKITAHRPEGVGIHDIIRWFGPLTIFMEDKDVEIYARAMVNDQYFAQKFPESWHVANRLVEWRQRIEEERVRIERRVDNVLGVHGEALYDRIEEDSLAYFSRVKRELLMASPGEVLSRASNVPFPDFWRELGLNQEPVDKEGLRWIHLQPTRVWEKMLKTWLGLLEYKQIREGERAEPFSEVRSIRRNLESLGLLDEVLQGQVTQEVLDEVLQYRRGTMKFVGQMEAMRSFLGEGNGISREEKIARMKAIFSDQILNPDFERAILVLGAVSSQELAGLRKELSLYGRMVEEFKRWELEAYTEFVEHEFDMEYQMRVHADYVRDLHARSTQLVEGAFNENSPLDIIKRVTLTVLNAEVAGDGIVAREYKCGKLGFVKDGLIDPVYDFLRTSELFLGYMKVYVAKGGAELDYYKSSVWPPDPLTNSELPVGFEGEQWRELVDAYLEEFVYDTTGFHARAHMLQTVVGDKYVAGELGNGGLIPALKQM